jgi:hypothetical protein
MSDLFSGIQKFFTDDEWYYLQLGNQPILQMTYPGKNGKWTCYAQVHEEQQIFFFYSVCPIDTPEEKRLLMAELLTRANYGLKVGYFDMNFADGEVRFKTSIDVGEENLSNTILRNLVYNNLWIMDHYLPGILSLIYSDITPMEVIQKMEA